MVLLTATPYIRATLSSLPPSVSSSLPSYQTAPEVGGPIDHNCLVALSRLLRTESNSSTGSSTRRCTLSALLRGTSIYVPPPPPKPAQSPEYLALKQRLLDEQEQRQYASYLRSTRTLDGLDKQDEHDDISPSLVFNILLSIVLCAGAVFHITRNQFNDGLRVLTSLLVGILVGVAEVTVYAGYLRKVEQSRKRERAKRERKEFIGEYVGPDEATEETEMLQSVEDGEKETIWGRGVNGGMRRRVREKWEKTQEKPEGEQMGEDR